MFDFFYALFQEQEMAAQITQAHIKKHIQYIQTYRVVRIQRGKIKNYVKLKYRIYI